MQIELRDIGAVKPYPGNPRINDDAVGPVADSIRRFGWVQPIVVDRDGVVIAGHTRLKAAAQLGLAQVPVFVAADLSPEQTRTLRLADNKTHELSKWDLQQLGIELNELKALQVDLLETGFAPDELAALLAPVGTEGATDPDDVPAPPAEATTRRGDIITLGHHRLMCGDSSVPADLDALLAGDVVHLVNTDPPYNVNVSPRSNNAIAAGLGSALGSTRQHEADTPRAPGKAIATHTQLRAKDRPLANDFVSPEEFERLLAAWFGNLARVLVPGGVFYIWGGYVNCANYPPHLRANELYFSQAVIWHKQHPVLTRKDFMGDHEWCFYGWREGAGHKFHGPNNVPDVWQVKKVNPQRMVHLTEKPVELARRAIDYSSLPGQVVLDMFGGSGSTLMACEMSGRRARLMELDPLYCDVIVERWEQFTGRRAERPARDDNAAAGAAAKEGA
jgi:DNA modification methylase